MRIRNRIVQHVHSRRLGWYSFGRGNSGTSRLKQITCYDKNPSNDDFVTRVLGGLFGRDDVEPLVFPLKMSSDVHVYVYYDRMLA
jgi:hypothetical protein